MMQVRRWCRLEGHSAGVVGSIFPSNEASGLLSPTMIISEGFLTCESLTSRKMSTSPPRPYEPPAGNDPQSLKPYEKRAVCVMPYGSRIFPGAVALRVLFRFVSQALFGLAPGHQNAERLLPMNVNKRGGHT